jgi:glycosyltransferase involved in cell wall biosynthesis
VRATAAVGIESYVAGIGDEFAQRDTAGHAAKEIFAANASDANAARGFSGELTRYLRERAPKVDLIHSHGLRNGIGLEAIRHARRTGLPLLVTPHGMLYPQLLDRSRIRKWVVERLWDARYRERARALHATSRAELAIIRKHHPDKPVAVVPIGLNVSQFPGTREGWLERAHPQLAGTKRLLFLGIMDRKKGLLKLADAWGRLHAQFPQWRLLIAGPDIRGHEAEVRRAVADAGVSEKTIFLGGVYGADKARLYAESDLFVLPTEWENFGIAVAEALASRVPVITTRGAPWDQLGPAGCGWWIENTADALTTTLRDAMNLNDDQRAAMGERGRSLIEQHFAWPKIASQMRELYEWVLGRHSRPGFVDG